MVGGAPRHCGSGHESADDDYCSVCGAPMPSVPRAAATTQPGLAGAHACPDCGEPRSDSSARFCEVCRFDFQSRQPGPPPTAAKRPVAASPAPADPAHAGVAATKRWEIVVQTDATLDSDPDPTAPFEARAEVVVAVDRPELLVGRTDVARDIHPEIALHDPGASRRHAKIVASRDGGIALQDLASTNGTRLNGAAVERGARVALNDGDTVVVGRWTRLRVRSQA
jgi:hypothetical protein